MNKIHQNLLLADDDIDDCIFFEDALNELHVSATLSTVNDGVQLISYLFAKTNSLPDVIFLDLNMPKKSGFECLAEIKKNDILMSIPVIIFSTSLDLNVVDKLYQMGAHRYIRKPAGYDKLKKVIGIGV
jgi:CheY-like chemotaxis protein